LQFGIGLKMLHRECISKSDTVAEVRLYIINVSFCLPYQICL